MSVQDLGASSKPFPAFQTTPPPRKAYTFPIATKEPNHENPARPDRRAALVFLRRQP